MSLDWNVTRVIPPMSVGNLDADPTSGLLKGGNVRQSPSPNYGGLMKHPAVIMVHFTASIGTVSRVISEMTGAGVSSHLVIERNGEIWQTVPFTRVAQHAGTGAWRTYQNNINDHSIGIELNNLGPLWMTESYKFIDSYGNEQADRDLEPLPHRNANMVDLKKLPEAVAYDAIIKKGVAKEKLNLFCYWERFPEEQQKALQRVCSLLVTRFPTIRAIIGHDDYAPLRKFDPGPALRMEKLVGWMPEQRIVIPPDQFRPPRHMDDRRPPDYSRNVVASRRFGGGLVGGDIS